MNLIKKINVLLGIVILLLIISLIKPFVPTAASIAYGLDGSSPKCYFKDSDSWELFKIPLNSCCPEIERQFRCDFSEEGLNIKCFISEKSGRYYLLNYKAYNYCQKEGYDVKTKG